MRNHHDEYAVLAVQGTKSDEVLEASGCRSATSTCPSWRRDFEATGVVVCRTGYTGERGYELIVGNEVAGALWDALLAAGEEYGMLACGLGARDTLRTEMGYPLHGQDITLDVTPNQARLGWAVGLEEGRVLGRTRWWRRRRPARSGCCAGWSPSGAASRARHGRHAVPDVPLCDITSGTFSPTLKKGIGLALVPTMVDPEAELGVDVRGRREIFQLVKVPFVAPVGARV